MCKISVICFNGIYKYFKLIYFNDNVIICGMLEFKIF